MLYLTLTALLAINVLCVKSVPQEDARPGQQNRSESNSADKSEDNTCPYTESPMPDFSALGRRISETKCTEYIWDVRRRAESIINTNKCFEWRWTLSNRFGPHYAIGGHITEPGEYPHMGAVGWKAAVGTWIFKCGSTLISSKYLLTAAHCSKASSRDTTIANTVPEIVRLGDKNIVDVFYNDRYPHDVLIKRIVVHPDFDPPKKYFDIAIIELQTEVTFSNLIQPACLWTKYNTSQLGSRATLTGWGVIETAGRTTSPELQAAEVEVIDWDYCDKLLRPMCNRHWCGLESHQLCAGNLSGGVDACQGDSGGPLQVRIPLPITSQGAMHYVIGVTSFGVGCARPNSPGVYTRVSSFVDWIEDVVWRGL